MENEKNFADGIYAGRRLREWIKEGLTHSDNSIEELSEALGFANPAALKTLLDGKGKFCWTTFRPLSNYFMIEPGTLIALFLDQDVDESIREIIFDEAMRIIPEWEMPFVRMARRTYIDGTDSYFDYTPDYMLNHTGLE